MSGNNPERGRPPPVCEAEEEGGAALCTRRWGTRSRREWWHPREVANTGRAGCPNSRRWEWDGTANVAMVIIGGGRQGLPLRLAPRTGGHWAGGGSQEGPTAGA